MKLLALYIIVSFTALISASVQADSQAGYQWLFQQQQDDGAVFSPDGISSIDQSTLSALSLAELTSNAASLEQDQVVSYLEGQAYSYASTGLLAQLLLAGITQTVDGVSIRELLINRQNSDGGFGNGTAHDSTPWDTAWALQALAKGGFNSESTNQALYYLTQGQEEDGSWLLTERSTLSVTAVVVKALNAYRYQFPVINTYYDEAISALSTQKKSDELWGSNFESALVLDSLLPSLTNIDSIQTSLSTLEAQQLENGSWDNDVYTTALALSLLHRVENNLWNPTLGSISGTIFDGVNRTTISNVSIELTGLKNKTVQTDSAGQFSFTNLQPGQYHIAINHIGYSALNWSGMLNVSEYLDLGSLFIVANDEADSFTGTVQGRVTERLSSRGLAGVTVSTSSGDTAITNENGEYLLIGIPAGDATIQFTHPAYIGASSSFSVESGKSYWLSPVLNNKSATEYANLSGIVSDSESSLSLSGVTISLSGANEQQTITASDGSFALDQLIAGQTTITIEKTGYHTVSKIVNLEPGTAYQISINLIPEHLNNTVLAQTSQITGIVIDSSNASPMENVEVSLVIDGSSVTVTSDENGAFTLEQGVPGEGLLTFILPGYQTAITNLQVIDGVNYNLGNITLSPEGTATLFAFSGVLVDSTTSAPISSAVITVQADTSELVIAPDENGIFAVSDLTEKRVSIEFEAEGYISSKWFMDLNDAFTDFHEIRLQPWDLESYQADLIVKRVDNQNAQASSDSLVLNGDIDVVIENRGLKAAEYGFDVIAFVDTDSDGAFVSTIDQLLGEKTITETLQAGESLGTTLSVEGELNYRGAPISVFIDAENKIVERDEDNNISNTAAYCQLETLEEGDLEPKLKWAWDGSESLVAPESNQVMMTPLVVPLEDTNADGLINYLDDRAIVFVSYKQHNYSSSGVLRAVRAKDGTDIWGVAGQPIAGAGAIAAADIDKDGMVEILVPAENNGKELLVFEHDGAYKWKITTAYGRDWGGPTVADLDGDGNVEILAAGTVFTPDENGELLNGGKNWVAGRVGGYGRGSFLIPIDVNNDGFQEVVGGGTIYSMDGEKIAYSSSIPDGFSAVANIDMSSQEPEIVVVRVSVVLIDSNGRTKWQAPLPGGGIGGPPTVADMDGDGESEIGVAGANAYTVFNADGSILWTQTTRDRSSNMTGSSVFDFEGDGRAEVAYADEQFLRIYDGLTGAELIKITSVSGTTHEYPVIADVDLDGHAEILQVSNNLLDPGFHGLRVFEGINDNWAPTRAIWNQHAYHIDNINDDGTVPTQPVQSWTTHNTFRLNTFAGGGVLDAYDLTLSKLTLIDNGVGQPFTLTALIANASEKPSVISSVDFYLGKPEDGGTLLGSSVVPALQLNQTVTVVLNDVENIAAGSEIYAVVNEQRQSSECRSYNNQQSIIAGTVIGESGLSLNVDTAIVGETLEISSQVNNTGSYTSDYRLVVEIEDSFGHQLVQFPEHLIEGLLSDASITVSNEWSVGNTVAGDYQVHSVLFDLESNVIDEHYAPFTILASDGSGAVSYDAFIATDKTVYSSYDEVELTLRIRNVALNASQDATEAVIQVLAPNNSEIYTETIAVAELAATEVKTYQHRLTLSDAVGGEYAVKLTLSEGVSSEQLAYSESKFTVDERAIAHLQGSVSVNITTATSTDDVTCTETLTNSSSRVSVSPEVSSLLLNLDTQEVISESKRSITLGSGATEAQSNAVDVAGLSSGNYACALRASVDGITKDLGYATFKLEVDEAEVHIDGQMSQSSRGRLLILMDSCSSFFAKEEDPLRISLCGYTTEDDADSQTFFDLSTAQEQRDYMASLLSENGWEYTLTTNAIDFRAEYETGTYSAVAFLSENILIDPFLLNDIIIDHWNGLGLLINGSFVRRWSTIESALGITVGSTYASETLVSITDKFIDDPVTWDFTVRHSWVVTSCEFNSWGVLPESLYSDLYFPVLTLGDAGCRPASIVHNRHGKGAHTYFAYDVVDHGTVDGGIHSQLILEALDAIQPQSFPIEGQDIIPVTVDINNAGSKASVDVDVLLPDGASIAHSRYPMLNSSTGTWQWQIDFTDAGQTQNLLFVKLPNPHPTEIVIQVNVRSGVSRDAMADDFGMQLGISLDSCDTSDGSYSLLDPFNLLGNNCSDSD